MMQAAVGGSNQTAAGGDGDSSIRSRSGACSASQPSLPVFVAQQPGNALRYLGQQLGPGSNASRLFGHHTQLWLLACKEDAQASWVRLGARCIDWLSAARLLP